VSNLINLDCILIYFQPGEFRDCSKTLADVSNQFTRAIAPNSKTALEKMVRETGTKDTVSQPILECLSQLGTQLWSQNIRDRAVISSILKEELERQKQLGPIHNPLLDMNGMILVSGENNDSQFIGVNIHLDTPTEILHTILLGVVKYFWGQTVFLIAKQKQFETFQARLESLNSDGLNIPQIMARYMCQYRGSLIGKHFKTIVQVIPHVIYDLVGTDLMDTWLLLGRLSVLLWYTDIPDTEKYLVSLEAADCYLSILAHSIFYRQSFRK